MRLQRHDKSLFYRPAKLSRNKAQSEAHKVDPQLIATSPLRRVRKFIRDLVRGPHQSTSSPDAQGEAYVSDELTHLVGWGPRGPKPLDDQYKILCSILSMRCVAKHPDTPGKWRDIEIDGFKKVSDNSMFNVHAICFCDIPVPALGIHMAKYGTFGLSFSKPFLVSEGASPVFYVATNAVSKVDFDSEGKPRQLDSRGHLFDTNVFKYVGLHVQRIMWDRQGRGFPEDAKALTDHINLLGPPSWFLHHYVFGHIKGFDSSLPTDHRDNFYMEREWRVPGDLKFSDGDVTRVILPRAYEESFRRAVPHYTGSITYAESIGGR